MKKKILFKILFIFILNIIFAEESSYSKSLNKVMTYMDTLTYRNTYKLYLYENRSDFISYDEYCSTLSKNNWLYYACTDGTSGTKRW